MPIYETVFIARQDLSDAQVKELVDSNEKIIKDGGGKILKTENWGLRTLSYRINKNRKGHYVLMESDTPAPALLEMERVMRLNEDVMRSLTIRLDEPTNGPSVMAAPDKDKNDKTEEKEAA